MRRLLDKLYQGSEVTAAMFVIAVWATVVIQVGLNLLDRLAGSLFGEPIGLVVPSYAELAGYFLAAATFLALASSWRAGAHVRG